MLAALAVPVLLVARVATGDSGGPGPVGQLRDSGDTLRMRRPTPIMQRQGSTTGTTPPAAGDATVRKLPRWCVGVKCSLYYPHLC